MDLDAQQIADRTKVGLLEGSPVWRLVTKGGLNVVVTVRNGKVEPLGMGPHRAIARHLAKKRRPEILWTELEKSEHVVDPAGPITRHYEMVTATFRRAFGW